MKGKRVIYTMLAAALLWLLFVAFADGVAKMTWSASSRAFSWVSKEELRSLAQYHGTDALRITEVEVAIWRDGEWIPVKKNESI